VISMMCSGKLVSNELWLWAWGIKMGVGNWGSPQRDRDGSLQMDFLGLFAAEFIR